MRILFVDDDAETREQYAERLGQWGFEVLVHADEASAHAAINEEGDRIDIALLDLIMSGPTSGIDLVQHVEGTHPEIPCVIFSEYANVENAAACMEAGAFSYVPKGCAEEVLKATLERAAEKRRLLRAAAEAEELKRMLREVQHGLAELIEILNEEVEQERSRQADELSLLKTRGRMLSRLLDSMESIARIVSSGGRLG